MQTDYVPTREFTNVAEMRANAVAVRERLLGLRKSARHSAPANMDDIAPVKKLVVTYRDEFPKDAHVVAYRQHIARQQCKAIPYLSARCEEIGIPLREITSDIRTRGIVRPRQIIMWEIKRTVKPWISFPELGRLFGGRDHTTALHAIRKIDEMIANGELKVGDDGKIIYKVHGQ